MNKVKDAHYCLLSSFFTDALQRPEFPDNLLRELSQGLAVDDRWKQVGELLGEQHIILS